MQTVALVELIGRQRPCWSLEQPFYTSEELYQFERRGWLAEQWYVLAHGSEVREPGSFIVRELLGESLIIVRDAEGVLQGFYNVCRHRGSRICDQDGHTARGFTCPYHAWSYRLDGTLRTAPALREGIDVRQFGLHGVPVREIGGIILGSLTADPQTLDAVQRELEPGLRYHGVPEARIAARRSYPTRGNWKLVMENFFECYHCVSSHPEYCSVMKSDVIALRSPTAAAALQKSVDTWLREAADPNSPIRSATEFPSYLDDFPMYFAMRAPIGSDRCTQSQDGRSVGPLMGRLRRFDGGVSAFLLQPFIHLLALNDHAVMFQFLPTAPQATDVLITWLVDPSALETDVDVERMVWLWDVTTQQDKALIERNAAGVRSQSYAPGPYSLLESWPARFVGRYLRELSARCSLC